MASEREAVGAGDLADELGGGQRPEAGLGEQLRRDLHLAARVQIMHPGPGRDHYRRKQAEHKSSAEALRSLKRQLAKVVYRQLRADHLLQTSPCPELT